MTRLPEGWEAVRGGRMGPGPCGHLHLVGGAYKGWSCLLCDPRRNPRWASAQQLRTANRNRLNMFYPEETP